jgi:hypothetical protein
MYNKDTKIVVKRKTGLNYSIRTFDLIAKKLEITIVFRWLRSCALRL